MRILRSVLLLLALGAPGWAFAAPPTPPAALESVPAAITTIAAPTLKGRPLTLPAGWAVAVAPLARLHGIPEDAVTLERLASHVTRRAPELAERLGVPFGAVVDIVLAPDDDLFASLQPGYTPDWADGTAWPSRGLIFLHAPSARRGDAPRLEQVLDHEIVHILVGRAFHGRPVPRWLQEGLAQHYAGEFGPETAETLSRAAGLGQLLPLQRISAGFPDDALGAQLAYAQTADFTAFLSQRAGGGEKGDAALRRLLAAGQRGAILSDAVVAATGESLETLEAEWLARWQSPWLAVDGLAQSGLPAAGAGILLAFGAWRRRRQFHADLERLDEEDRAEDARKMHARVYRSPRRIVVDVPVN